MAWAIFLADAAIMLYHCRCAVSSCVCCFGLCASIGKEFVVCEIGSLSFL